ncbi:uncharacterized protein LOC109946440 [Prunus persica]|nr:uncharacterized protein LOC109946440 [Prunus persica]XP_020409782.1 uncharacterized protein LOC109946440 [Prunus persica]XP_020409783.1 uncharacterized protein LOC109946440 [Prunus persica]XP_020409784.1 uncharacterized protein LOC109946440 [Prunus persica]XP_020409785.1 uncharacterized protein LOC109946440 [Prunus persica]XP_020409786.1 uncharacterized protein LOC109946440 [Prunus persica]
MEEDDGSSKYPGNEIIKSNGADAGIFASRTSDVRWSNTAEGQGSNVGTKLEGDGHNLGNIKYNISDNTITALNGESDVGMFIFHNIGFYWSNASQGQGGREGNKGFLKPKDGKTKGGSSSAQGQGGGGGTKPKGDGYNIRGNNIKGDGDRKAFHKFGNIEYNLKTTNTEDDGSTSQANIRRNTITASNGASYVGMFNFHNADVWSNAGQGQGGRQGNKGFPKLKGISHNICNNKIRANKSTNVGLQNFGNIRYNCKTTSIYGWLGFVGFWYIFQNFVGPMWL